MYSSSHPVCNIGDHQSCIGEEVEMVASIEYSNQLVPESTYVEENTKVLLFCPITLVPSMILDLKVT